MKAYVTSVGERTTELCCWQLERLGFKVVLLDKVEPWIDKYKHFIQIAEGPCIRIDADIIPNKQLVTAFKEEWESQDVTMVQWQQYDFYKNDLCHASPVFYSKAGLLLLRGYLDELDPARPESSAWRLPFINRLTVTKKDIVGIHGFFQDQPTIDRAKQNKIDRGQNDAYDWELVEKVMELL